MEVTEERSGMVSSTQSEPIFDVIHGLPGTGKSKVIAWICELFTDVLGWESGNQFVCLAVQNTMAANIGGHTIHHWGSIPFRDEKGNEIGRKGGKRDTRLLFHRCINLRWVLIDEISMVSAELLSELQYLVRQAVRGPGTYKKRPDKSIRPFGGVNTLLLGDWWQLRPVRATALFDHPSKAKSDLAYEGAMLLWGQNRDSVQKVWELKVSKRCTDPWFTDVLTQCRNGQLALEDYLFLHGMPTLKPGSAISDKLTCGDPNCENLEQKWGERFLDHKKLFADAKEREKKEPNPEKALKETLKMIRVPEECEICTKHRKARAVVAMTDEDVRFKEEPFSTAPYIHQLNEPKHAANLERAVKWAEVNKRSINWVTAHDYPLHRDDQARFFFCDTSPQCNNRARRLLC